MSTQALIDNLEQHKFEVITKYNLRALRFFLLLVTDFQPNVGDILAQSGQWQNKSYVYDAIVRSLVRLLVRKSTIARWKDNVKAVYNLLRGGKSQQNKVGVLTWRNMLRITKLKTKLVRHEKAVFSTLVHQKDWSEINHYKLALRCARGERKVEKERKWSVADFRKSLLNVKQDFFQKHNLRGFSRQALHFVKINGQPRESVQEICWATQLYDPVRIQNVVASM